MTVLALLIALPVQGRVKKNNKKAIREIPRKMPRVHEPVYLNTFGADHRFGPKVDYSNRDSEWSAGLIDSSLNGYGAYNPTPNPLGHAMDEGYVAVYRQFQGLTATAGSLDISVKMVKNGLLNRHLIQDTQLARKSQIFQLQRVILRVDIQVQVLLPVVIQRQYGMNILILTWWRHLVDIPLYL